MQINKNDRHVQLAVSVGAGVAGQFVYLIAPLVLMPAMLAYLGDVVFGIWAAGVAITGVSAFLDLGIGNGLLSRLAHAYGIGDHRASRRYIASAYAVLSLICLGGISALALATAAGVGSHFSPATWPIVLIMFVSFFVSMPASLIYRVLQAQLRIPLQSVLQIAGAVSSIAACLTAIKFEADAWIVVAAYSATPVTVMGLASGWYFVANPFLRPRRKDFSLVETRNLLGLGSSFFVLSILLAISQNVDTLILSYVAGPEAVANFFPPMRLGAVMVAFIGQIYMPLWSFNGEALARGDVAWVRRTTAWMSIGGAAFVLFSGLVLVFLSDYIMMLWMGRTFDDQNLVLLGMTAASATMAFTSPYNMVLNAKGLAREQISPWLAFILLSVPLKFGLLSEDSAWMAPAITFGCYCAIVMPAMVYRGRLALTAP